jgi:hypothetical protein
LWQPSAIAAFGGWFGGAGAGVGVGVVPGRTVTVRRATRSISAAPC